MRLVNLFGVFLTLAFALCLFACDDTVSSTDSSDRDGLDAISGFNINRHSPESTETSSSEGFSSSINESSSSEESSSSVEESSSSEKVRSSSEKESPSSSEESESSSSVKSSSSGDSSSSSSEENSSSSPEESSSSSSEESSSSSSEESSSSEASSSSVGSSSAVVKGYCAVSKRKVFVGDEVDWYIVDAEGNVLEGTYNWVDIGNGAELVAGEQDGTGSTKITVTYSTTGQKAAMVQWAKQGMMNCDRNELDEDDFDPLLVVDAKPQTSASAAPED